MCECITHVNKALYQKGLELVTLLHLSVDPASLELVIPIQTVEKPVFGKKPRGKQSSPIFANYCPFCGEKWKPSEAGPQTRISGEKEVEVPN